MEAALLLELQNYNPFDFVIDVSLLKKPLCETIFVEAFEDVFFVEIAENLDDLVNSIV